MKGSTNHSMIVYFLEHNCSLWNQCMTGFAMCFWPWQTGREVETQIPTQQGFPRRQRAGLEEEEEKEAEILILLWWNHG